MFTKKKFRRSLLALAAAIVLAAGVAPAVQSSGEPMQSQTAAAAPMYREYRGVHLGASAADVREKLGKPTEGDETMDFFVFSDTQRARVYYGPDGTVTAIVATYIGQDSGAPAPESVIGMALVTTDEGSGSKMVRYEKEGYWVNYSRTAGDEPYVFITMQKVAS